MIDPIGTLRSIKRRVDLIFALVNAVLTLQETGGMVAAPDVAGTEVVVWQVAAPLGVFNARIVKINLDNMIVGDTTEIRVKYKMTAGGAYVQEDYRQYIGADGGLPNGNKLITIALDPNRQGVQVTLAMTAGAVRNYPWFSVWES